MISVSSKRAVACWMIFPILLTRCSCSIRFFSPPNTLHVYPTSLFTFFGYTCSVHDWHEKSKYSTLSHEYEWTGLRFFRKVSGKFINFNAWMDHISSDQAGADRNTSSF